jgi:uncharacterized membrane-anchored protein YhcB (DUF1043 family)
MSNEDKRELLALLVGVMIGAVLMGTICTFTYTSIQYDEDLQKIQRQRNAMRLYEEASK